MMTETFLADLHSHTTASDGQLSPTELIERAYEKGVEMLAITDHDTIGGLAEAEAYNQTRVQLNPEQKLTLIHGVEISTRWHHFDIHIVGLNFDANHAPLQAFLSQQQALRIERAEEIGRRLAKAGIEGAYQGAQRYADGDAISRAHFARFLIEKGYATDMGGVFKRYLARNKTGYVPNNWHDMATAIAQIHDAGGVAVLAHPSGYQLSNKWLRKLVTEFAQAGGDAMEVVLGQQSIDDRNFLAELCTKANLYASVGSDFHYVGRFLELGRNLYQPKGLNWVWQAPRWRARDLAPVVKQGM